jgi:tetratricopeptide (TPR) repeat protein
MHGKIPMHEKEWQIKIGREIAKIASNLSMLYLASGEKDEALKFATDATKMSPEWHKAYCRRALALVALGQYNEAHVAVFNAIKKCSVEIDGGVELVMNRKELKEYKKIKADIQTKMGCANEHDSIFEGNPLYQPLDCKLSSDDKDAGTIFSIVATLDIMDLVYNLLTPMGCKS